MDRTPLSAPALSVTASAHVTALLAASVGALLQLGAGVPEFQPFPLGVLALLGAAGVVLAFPGRRWAPAVGVAVAVVLLVEAFALGDGAALRLGNPLAPLAFVATLLQTGGAVAAVVAGLSAAAVRPQQEQQVER